MRVERVGRRWKCHLFDNLTVSDRFFVLLLVHRLFHRRIEFGGDLLAPRQVFGDFWFQFIDNGRIVVAAHHRHEALDSERVQLQRGVQVAIVVGLNRLSDKCKTPIQYIRIGHRKKW